MNKKYLRRFSLKGNLAYFKPLRCFTNFGNNNSGSVGFGQSMYSGSVDLLFGCFYA